MRSGVLRFFGYTLILACGVGYSVGVSASDVAERDFVQLWKVICPVAGYRHGFVAFSDLKSLLDVPGTPSVAIDGWTSVLANTSEDPSRFTVRLEVSQYEDGTTSGWIPQDPKDKSMEVRSELTVDARPFLTHMPVDAVARSLSKLGYAEIGSIPLARGISGEKLYVREHSPEQVRVRFKASLETAPEVQGLTLIGYRRKGAPVEPFVDHACP